MVRGTDLGTRRDPDQGGDGGEEEESGEAVGGLTHGDGEL